MSLIIEPQLLGCFETDSLAVPQRSAAHLQASLFESGCWIHAVHSYDAERTGEIVALAEWILPLESIATGPGQETGLGPGFEVHHCLDYILQDLGHGPRLIETGLRSPADRRLNFHAPAINLRRSSLPDNIFESIR